MNPSNDDVCDKYVAMKSLRAIGTAEAAKILEEGYPLLGTSELLRHDVMYCMGQMRAPNSLSFLLERMHDENERPVVRHEAGEALSNYHALREQLIPEMKKHWDSPDELLKSTVRVGIGKLETYHEGSRYGKKFGGTIEPAEPFNEEEVREYLKKRGLEVPQDFGKLLDLIEHELLQPYSVVDEFPKYRMVYFLRDIADQRSKEILCKLVSAQNRQVVSPLLRHELCFIMGQINNGDKLIQDTLKAVGLEVDEHPVVRHEAILSFYEVTKDDAFIDQFMKDENQLIRESVEVAVNVGEQM